MEGQWAAGTGCDAVPILEYLTEIQQKKFDEKESTSVNGLKNSIWVMENLW
jgi:deoxyribodipyrimidine photolyase